MLRVDSVRSSRPPRGRGLLVVALVALVACARVLSAQSAPASRYPSPDSMEAAARATYAAGAHGTARRMMAVAQAYRQLGRPYRFGASGTRGAIDCSALVQWAYARAGLRIPRTSVLQARTGQPLPRAVAALVPGDLLFFGAQGQVSHAGMYLGGGYFVHAASSLKRVAISSLHEPRWSRLWLAARRVGEADTDLRIIRGPEPAASAGAAGTTQAGDDART